MNRAAFIHQLESTTEFDLCIIGGGATGLGIALDAASRGLKTVLFEQYDFAKGTSSRSTKLVHGGVRYLQQGNIKLVMEALRERGLLLQNAPGLVHNQQFIIPNYKWWERSFYGIGLKIYDKMAGNLGLGPSRFLSKEETLQLAPTLDPTDLRGGVLYHDGQFDDARLAMAIALTAAQKGAVVLNYFPVTAFLKMQQRICGVWAKDSTTGKDYEIRSRAVINATGVFTDTLQKMDEPFHEAIIHPSQGIHLVVEKEFLPGNSAIMIPRTDDGRVLFAVPWHDKIVLGTTDTAVKNITPEPVPMNEEIDFILGHIGRYLHKDPQRRDVTSMFAGLRPLVKGRSQKTAALSRDHLVTISSSGLITVTGGKWTTYRKMAEDAVTIAQQQHNLPDRPCITRDLPLTGMTVNKIPPSLEHREEKEIRSYIVEAVREEMCLTVEDFLARRTRQLFLDAESAIQLAPFVAREMAAALHKEEDWIIEQINNFKAIAVRYLPDAVAS